MSKYFAIQSPKEPRPPTDYTDDLARLTQCQHVLTDAGGQTLQVISALEQRQDAPSAEAVCRFHDLSGDLPER